MTQGEQKEMNMRASRTLSNYSADRAKMVFNLKNLIKHLRAIGC